MRYGVSFHLQLFEQVALAKNAGFDYVECGFQHLVRGTDEMLDNYRRALKENDILCEAANCFLPGDLPIIGTDFARAEMKDYIETGMARGSEMGLQVVAFGSGGARKLPEDVPFLDGMHELAAFLRHVVSPIAGKFGITVVIEPLRRTECNMIHTLDEGAMLTGLVDRPNISVLADVYHMWGAGETFADLRRLKGSIFHGHISNPETPNLEAKRTFPLEEGEFDYKGFVDALRAVGCTRCSIEARCYDFASEIAKSGPILKAL